MRAAWARKCRSSVSAGGRSVIVWPRERGLAPQHLRDRIVDFQLQRIGDRVEKIG
jgi:hypothetical protein